MSRLDELAPLATTGVGSLPFDDLDEAVRHALRAYDLPFCPQLPARDGDMIAAWLSSAWYRFIDELATQDAGRPGLVKLQVTGPYTLAMATDREMSSDALMWSAREFAERIAAAVQPRIAALRQLDVDTLLIVDEPGIGHAGMLPRGDDADTPWDALRTTGAAGWGLHICGRVPWDLVVRAAPDVLSFDAIAHPATGAALAPLRQLVATGTRIAWGVVDPAAPGSAEDVADRIARCLAAIGPDASEYSLLTPTCGSGRLTPADERLVAAVLGAAASIADDEAAARWPPDPTGLV